MSNNKEIQDRPKDTLYNRCTGYDYYKDVAIKLNNETLSSDGKTIITKETIKIIKIKKHRHPNLNAQKQWFNKKCNKDYLQE